MTRPKAPSMPTEAQIQQALKTVASLHPGARIVRVGPEGVEFEYASETVAKTSDPTPLEEWKARNGAA